MRIGIIGGSGLYELTRLGELAGENTPDTPFGPLSAPLQRYRPDSGPEVYFLPRHGRDHHLPPHQVNYRANMYALFQLQLDGVIAVNAVGGIHASQAPGLLVIPDQVIDYSYGREQTYAGTGFVDAMHVDFSYPYDAGLGAQLLAAAQAHGFAVIDRGVYGCTQGPRLESAAEIQRLARDGCDVVGMTGMPEAALARELGLPYACLALVVNPAAGVVEEEISMAEMQRCMAAGVANIETLLATFIANYQAL